MFGENVFWNREEAVKWAVHYFQGAIGAHVGATESYGMCATIAGPGCGKSHALDLLCRLHDAKDAQGALILGNELNKRLVPVCISFAEPQEIGNDKDVSPAAMLYARPCNL